LGVIECASIVVYYLHDGRNAWHSTWVQRYNANCFHHSIDSAKSSAERMRTRGSVFYVYEKPALLFRDDKHAMLIVQINSKTPFAGFIDRKNSGQVSKRRPKYKIAAQIRRGMTYVDVVEKMKPASQYWEEWLPLNNSVIIEFGPYEKNIELLSERKMLAWKSYSYGGNYRLGWSPIKNDVCPVSTIKLAKRVMRRPCFLAENTSGAD